MSKNTLSTEILSGYDFREVRAAPVDRRRWLERTLVGVGAYVDQCAAIALYASLVIVYAWFGGMKFTAYEANGLFGLVSNSPALSWAYAIFSVREFSAYLGVLELAIAGLIAARLLSPKLSLIGGLLSSGLFLTTLTLMISTPGVFEPELGFPAITVAPGQFLLKDAGLLAISLWITANSLRSAWPR